MHPGDIPVEAGHGHHHNLSAMDISFEELDTPNLLVDMDRLTENLDRMAAYTTLHGLRLRPHVKTHKSPRIAAEQLRRGAVGVTCATMYEAAVMSDVTDDILIAYPPVGAARLDRLMQLPGSVRVGVAVDNTDALPALAAAADISGRVFDVYVEIDVGMKRVGVDAEEDAIRIARTVAGSTSLRYAGILFYPGHIRANVSEQDILLRQLSENVEAFSAALSDAGLAPAIISGGSTPAAWRMHEVHGVNEVRPGTYVYNDRTTAAIGACDWEDCALTVLATVVSTSVPGQAVVDAGTKSLGREPLRADGAGFGALLDRPEVTVMRMSEEHGILDLSATGWRPRLGERVRIVPNHVCIVVHLFDQVFGVRGSSVETSWSVAARGRSQLNAGGPAAPPRPRAV